MTKNKSTMFIFLALTLSTQCVVGNGQNDFAQDVLRKAINNGLGPIEQTQTGICMDSCGYPRFLPDKTWRETHKLTNGYQWVVYYQLLSGEQKGEVIKKHIAFYDENDLRYILWLDKQDRISQFTKKISNVSLLRNPDKGIELTASAFVNYDDQGQLIDVSESLLLIDDKNKETDYVDFSIGSDGEVKDLENGKFDYYQLER